jgi:hypothetical protein
MDRGAAREAEETGKKAPYSGWEPAFDQTVTGSFFMTSRNFNPKTASRPYNQPASPDQLSNALINYAIYGGTLTDDRRKMQCVYKNSRPLLLFRGVSQKNLQGRYIVPSAPPSAASLLPVQLETGQNL